jgi:hypothetical protein
MCDGMSFPAFSGMSGYENNPAATALTKIGPLPAGRYYIIDRESGGHLGWIRDMIKTDGTIPIVKVGFLSTKLMKK